MLKTTRLFEKLALIIFRSDDDEVVRGSGGSETVRNSSKKLTCVPNIGAIRELNFLTPNAKKTFNHLRLAFIKTPILRYFNLESYIRIETDASRYAIGRVLSQLNLDSNAPLNDSNLDKSDFS